MISTASQVSHAVGQGGARQGSTTGLPDEQSDSHEKERSVCL